MQEWMTAAGIEPQRLSMEEHSENTLENLRAAADLLSGTDAPLIVTSRFHCFRVSLYARRFWPTGVTMLPVRTPVHAAPIWYLRETLMIVRYCLTGQ